MIGSSDSIVGIRSLKCRCFQSSGQASQIRRWFRQLHASFRCRSFSPLRGGVMAWSELKRYGARIWLLASAKRGAQVRSAPWIIRAIATEQERDALRLATQRVTDSLTAAGADGILVESALGDSDASADRYDENNIVIVSLLRELDPVSGPWKENERRLRELATRLGRGNGLLYIMTVFRHVSKDEDPELADMRRVRIRRLNLLAAELSRQTGALLIDIDRALADVGARVLGADYRLQGPLAAEAAARCIADALLASGFDQDIPFAALQSARAHLPTLNPLSPAVTSARFVAAGLNTLSMRVGRRSQTVETFGESRNQAALYLRALASGQISLLDTIKRFNGAIRRRGLRRCMALLWRGMMLLTVKRNHVSKSGHP